MNTPRAIFYLLFVATWLMAAVSTLSAGGALIGPPANVATVSGNGTAHHIITEPGSYYLSDNLNVTKATGINIQSPGVTLDLNGFHVRRASDSGGHGILIAVGADHCTVKNGSIAGFAYGVRAFSKGGGYLQLKASNCVFAGLVGGSDWLIDDCEAYDNREIDIFAGDGSRVITRPASSRPTRGSESAWLQKAPVGP